MMPSLENLDLQNEVVEVDGRVDSEQFFMTPLPDDGEHVAVLSLGDRGVRAERQKDKITKEKNGKWYLMAHLAAQILSDDGTPGMMVFDNPTSIVMPNTGTSKLHAIVDVAGHKAEPVSNLAELKTHVERALAQNPRVKIKTQWEAQAKAETQDQAAKAGVKVGEYYTIAKGQKKFQPILDDDGQPTGKYDSEILDPASGEKVRAQARILRYGKV